MTQTQQIPLDEIIGHARDEYPNECCGLVVLVKGRLRYKRCRNISEQPQLNFTLHPEDYESAEDEGEILYVAHSHPDDTGYPSLTDQLSQARTGTPWVIIGLPNGRDDPSPDIQYINSKAQEMPLYGRKYVHGVQDCYSFVRDYFQMEHGIFLKDYYRGDMWWQRGQDLYMEHFREEGFYEIPFAEAKEGDVFMMKISSPVINHTGIYLGGNQFGHHITNRLSSRDVYGQFYRNRTEMVLRCKELNG